ncbi:MAG: WG repeat-containing protein [Cytophagaceae bacterium]
MAQTISKLLILPLLVITFLLQAQTNCREGLCTYKDPKKNLYGFSDDKGKIIIPPKYDEIIDPFYLGRAIVMYQQKVGMIDKKGVTVIPFEYKEVLKEQFDLIPVRNLDNQWGFYSLTGTLVTPCQYDNFKIIHKGKQILVQEAGKWGLITHKGVEQIPTKYKNIIPVHAKQFEVIQFDKWSILDSKGKKIGELEYDSTEVLTQTLFRVNLNGWQFISDVKGKLVSTKSYTGIGQVFNNLVTVQRGVYWGVNTMPDMNPILAIEYNNISIDSIGIKTGKRSGYKTNWQYYTYEGKLITKNNYTQIRSLKNDRMAVQNNSGRWGFITEDGEEVISCQFDSVGNFKLGYATVIQQGSTILINKNGEVVLSGQDYYLYQLGLLRLDAFQKKYYVFQPNIPTEVSKGNKGQIKMKQKGLYGVVSSNGDILLSAKYDDVNIGLDEGVYGVKRLGKWKVAHSSGKEYSVDKRIVWIDGFYEGYAAMKFQSGEYGYINVIGQIFIAPQYKSCKPFNNDRVIVQINTKWGVLNKMEQWIAQPLYSEFSDFRNHLAIVKEGAKYYLLRDNGKINSNAYDKITYTPYGYYLVESNDKKGVHDNEGKEIISVRYEDIEILSPTLFKVEQYDLWGIINYQQELLVQFSYEGLSYNYDYDCSVGHNKATSKVIHL